MSTFEIVNLVFLWVGLVLTIILLLATIRKVKYIAANAPNLDTLKSGEKAPDFNVKTLDGQEITKKNYTGNDLVLVFVSPDCRPCHDTMPTLVTLYPKAKEAGTELLTVSLGDQKS